MSIFTDSKQLSLCGRSIAFGDGLFCLGVACTSRPAEKTRQHRIFSRVFRQVFRHWMCTLGSVAALEKWEAWHDRLDPHDPVSAVSLEMVRLRDAFQVRSCSR